jgi:tetratricopeptide (TPR) repeat protein
MCRFHLAALKLFANFESLKDINAAKLFGDEAANIYERAITTILNKNMLLYFAYADFEEGRSRYEKVHNIYTRLLDIPDINPTLVNHCISFAYQ